MVDKAALICSFLTDHTESESYNKHAAVLSDSQAGLQQTQLVKRGGQGVAGPWIPTILNCDWLFVFSEAGFV